MSTTPSTLQSTPSPTPSIISTTIIPAAATSAQLPSSQASPALSTNAQAGIGIGAALVGVAAIIGCGIYAWRLKKKKNGSFRIEAQQPLTHSGEDSQTPEEKAVTQPERPAEEPRYAIDPVELTSIELGREPVELEGDFPSHRYQDN